MDENKAFALLREIMEKFGQTAEAAWPHVVNSYYAESLAGLIVSLFGLLAFITGGIIANIIAWKVNCTTEDRCAVAGITGILLLIFGALLCMNFADSFPGVIEPEGGLIRSILK